MTQTAADALALKVWEFLSDGEWHGKDQLNKKFGNNRTAAALSDLMTAGVIEHRVLSTPGRPRNEYRATLTENQMRGRPSIHECPDETWLEPFEAALIIGTKEATVIEHIKRGRLRGKQIGSGRWQVQAGEARQFAAARTATEEAMPTIGEHARVTHQNGHRPAAPPTPTTIASGSRLKDVIAKARAELKIIEEQLTILETRKAELTEVMTAAETVNRYLTVAP
jgi:hypothetical protein